MKIGTVLQIANPGVDYETSAALRPLIGAERSSNFLRGCAGRSNRRERQSHAVRRDRRDAKRTVRGLGGPQPAYDDS